MTNCYTLDGHRLVAGIRFNIEGDFAVFGAGRSRRILVSTDSPPKLVNGRCNEVYLEQERKDDGPQMVLSSIRLESDENGVLVFINTIRNVKWDDVATRVPHIQEHLGTPKPLFEAREKVNGLIAMVGLYYLLPGDAICVRPLGVPVSNWAHQQVIFFRDNGEVTALPRRTYYARFGRTRKTEENRSSLSSGTVLVVR